MNLMKIYCALTGLLIIVLLGNGVVSAISYLKQVELTLDDITSVISVISFMCVILSFSEISAWLCCNEVTPFKLIAIGNLCIDVVITAAFSYLNGAYIRDFEDFDEDTPFVVPVLALSISCPVIGLIKILLLLYGLYKDMKNNKVSPDTEMNSIEKKPQFSSNVNLKNEIENTLNLPTKLSSTAPGSEYFLVDVDQNSEEYKSVIDDFIHKMEPNTANNIRLQRIQNEAVYARYKAYKQEALKEKPTIQKQILFYATSNVSRIEQICRFGFIDATNSVFHTEKNGVCFSYYPKLFDDRLTASQRRMFRVKVIPESEVIGDEKIFDTTKNEHLTDYVDGSIYICTNEAQSYPEYLITYTSS